MSNKVNNPLTHAKLVSFAKRLNDKTDVMSAMTAQGNYSYATDELLDLLKSKDKSPDTTKLLWSGVGGCGGSNATRTHAYLSHQNMTKDDVESLNEYCPRGYHLVWHGTDKRVELCKA